MILQTIIDKNGTKTAKHIKDENKKERHKTSLFAYIRKLLR